MRVQYQIFELDSNHLKEREGLRHTQKRVCWFRKGNLDHDWWAHVYECHKEKIEAAGFYVTDIYFSGFWSQGDGAMFEYDYLNDKLRLEFIDQLGLSPMRKDWLINNTTINGRGKHLGHYYHKKSCDHSIYWDVDNGDLAYGTLFYNWLDSFASYFKEFVIDKYEDLCNELYKALEEEYDYLNSDEVVDETIIVNEYDFDEDGGRFRY